MKDFLPAFWRKIEKMQRVGEFRLYPEFPCFGYGFVGEITAAGEGPGPGPEPKMFG